MEAADWRTQLQAYSRQKIVHKIMEALERRLPLSGQQGLQQLEKIAARFEEKIYTEATSQSDYQRKIYSKMLTVENNFPDPMPNTTQSNAAGNSQNSPYPASQGMQSQVNNNQGQLPPFPVPNNQSQAGQQLLAQNNVHKKVASTGVRGPSSLNSGLPPPSSLSQSSMLNVGGQNSNMQNISGVLQSSLGNSMMDQGLPSNIYANSQRQMQGRQQPGVPQQQQQQQPQLQQFQNSQQFLSHNQKQQLQHQPLKRKFQQGNIPHSEMQSHMQQQQNNNLLQQSSQLQSSQQSVMQPPVMQSSSISSLQQNHQQPSVQQSTQSVIQQHARPKQPSKKVVDFDSINTVINYNGVGKKSISDHPSAVHNLLGYTPIGTDWIAERSNQPDWVGPSKRPSKLEDRQRVKKKPPTRPQIPTGIVIREGPVENVGVTFTGQILGAAEKGKAVEVGPSQNTSETPTDPEINQLFNESDVEDTATMAPKRRNIAASLQKGGGSGGSPGGEGQHKKQKKEPIRYGFRKDAPPVEVIVEEPQPVEAAAERSEEVVRPDDVVLEDGAPDSIWRPVFKYGGRELMESDSLYQSPSVAAAIMYGTAKASDVAEHAQTPSLQLRNEALQDFLKAAQKFMVLDDRRVIVGRAQEEALQKLQQEKELLKEALKKKKKELDTAQLLASSLDHQLKEAQKEVDSLRAKDEQRSKEISELKSTKQKDLDDAEQRGYDACFDEQVAAVQKIQSRLYQAGYNFGLDQALIPSTSELRTSVEISKDFQYEVEPITEVEAVQDVVQEPSQDTLVIVEEAVEGNEGVATNVE